MARRKIPKAQTLIFEWLHHNHGVLSNDLNDVFLQNISELYFIIFIEKSTKFSLTVANIDCLGNDEIKKWQKNISHERVLVTEYIFWMMF